MASGIPSSTSKGKAKIPVSSSSTKGVSYSKGGGGDSSKGGGGGGGDEVPPGGGGGDGVPPGGGAVGGRPRRMVDIFRRVRVAGQREEEELLVSINILCVSSNEFKNSLDNLIRWFNMMPRHTLQEYWCGTNLFTQYWFTNRLSWEDARNMLTRVVLDGESGQYLRIYERNQGADHVLLCEVLRSEVNKLLDLENVVKPVIQVRIDELYAGLVAVEDYEFYFVTGAHTKTKNWLVNQVRTRGWGNVFADIQRVVVRQAEELYMENMKKPFSHHGCWEICKGWVLFQDPPQERFGLTPVFRNVSSNAVGDEQGSSIIQETRIENQSPGESSIPKATGRNKAQKLKEKGKANDDLAFREEMVSSFQLMTEQNALTAKDTMHDIILITLCNMMHDVILITF
ncbi:hypothetical protein C1H46_017768 [Malus baccata]|uniref:Uncharacterized protein n=1 Tax=Malus baccata TaxID=106549 RepID=A0A540MCX3_MALBA|nr:hypothetical protein C1H46_017768 [Malus baccata]